MTTASDYQALTGLRPDEAAGLRQVRRARETGTLVGVYDSVEAGIDDWGFATVCEAHGRLVIHDTLTLARIHATNPTGWCGICAGTEADDR